MLQDQVGNVIDELDALGTLTASDIEQLQTDVMDIGDEIGDLFDELDTKASADEVAALLAEKADKGAFDDLVATVTDLDTFTKSLETDLNALETTVSGLSTSVVDIDGRVDALEDGSATKTVVEELSTAVASVQTTVGSLSTSLDTLSGRVDTLSAQVDLIATDVSALKTGKADKDAMDAALLQKDQQIAALQAAVCALIPAGTADADKPAFCTSN